MDVTADDPIPRLRDGDATADNPTIDQWSPARFEPIDDFGRWVEPPTGVPSLLIYAIKKMKKRWKREERAGVPLATTSPPTEVVDKLRPHRRPLFDGGVIGAPQPTQAEDLERDMTWGKRRELGEEAREIELNV
ncbi:hypothetical protein CRG98_031598 [Punica granatum]|uniref:Uncharacterized protein n=1 Tax=Punica granatum TaxID=22663 RepID=A0A2I0IVI7_PUNGR|nr:hypothetical protein CRG98_031598 [Punica granatum]